MDIELAQKLDEKNEILKSNLSKIYESLESEYVVNYMRKKPLDIKFGSRLTQHIFLELTKQPLMDSEEFARLDADDLKIYLNKYLEFITIYSKIEISSTRHLF